MEWYFDTMWILYSSTHFHPVLSACIDDPCRSHTGDDRIMISSFYYSFYIYWLASSVKTLSFSISMYLWIFFLIQFVFNFLIPVMFELSIIWSFMLAALSFWHVLILWTLTVLSYMKCSRPTLSPGNTGSFQWWMVFQNQDLGTRLLLGFPHCFWDL